MNAAPAARSSSGSRSKTVWIAVGLAVVLLLVSIVVWALLQEPYIETQYGGRTGAGHARSVNGTAVLAGMFEQAGHKVSSTSYLSPRLAARADVIVWFPDSFQHPDEKVQDWFDDWLSNGRERVLVYVGRDYDAAPDYWEKIRATAPPQQQPEISRRLNLARSAYQARRNLLSADSQGDWFTFQPAPRGRDVRTLDGGQRWNEGLDPSKLEIKLNGRLVPPEEADVLLVSEGDPLVSDLLWTLDNRIILVDNGSFLLNYPLINHEHRKLAGKLIAEIGDSRRVVFLESGPGGPAIRDGNYKPQRNGLEILAIAPFDLIFLHLAALGVIFCFSRFPQFGAPRRGQAAGVCDFGQHVTALGKLLERTQDLAYALARLRHYRYVQGQQAVQRSGRTRSCRTGAAAGRTVAGAVDQTIDFPTAPEDS